MHLLFVENHSIFKNEVESFVSDILKTSVLRFLPISYVHMFYDLYHLLCILCLMFIIYRNMKFNFQIASLTSSHMNKSNILFYRGLVAFIRALRLYSLISQTGWD